MALESIGLGASANDGTGDDLRTAGGKINSAFSEIYTALGDGTTLVSVTVFGRSLLDDADAATARTTLGAAAVSHTHTLANITDAGTAAAAATGDFATAAQGATADSAAQIHAEAIGDGSATSIAVTHNLGTRDVIVQLYDASTFAEVIPDVTRTDVNTVTLAFGSAPTAGQYRVVVQG